MGKVIKKAVKKVVKKAVKKIIHKTDSERLRDEIVAYLENQKRVYILCTSIIDDCSLILLIKKTELTVITYNNHNVFQPHEGRSKKVYGITLILKIGNNDDIYTVDEYKQLIDVGCTFYSVKSVDEVKELLEL